MTSTQIAEALAVGASRDPTDGTLGGGGGECGVVEGGFVVSLSVGKN